MTRAGRLVIPRIMKNPFLYSSHSSPIHKPKSLTFCNIVSEHEQNKVKPADQMSYLSGNGSFIKKDSFVLNSTNEKVLYLLSKDYLSTRLYSFLTELEILIFLNACKHQLLKKSRTLSHRVFRKATEPMILDHLIDSNEINEIRLKPSETLLNSIEKVKLLSFWNLFIAFEAFKPEEDFKYNRSRKSSEEVNIEDDIGRTIPDKMVTSTSRSVLKSVLLALSNSVPQLGYIQGLNSIVGSLTLAVMGLAELDAENNIELVQQIVYCNLKYFLVGRGFLLFYTDGFLRYRSLCLQLGFMLRAVMPELSNHFVGYIHKSKVNFELGPLTMKWFFTLFSEFLPPWMVDAS
jgi:hypothetical protein